MILHCLVLVAAALVGGIVSLAAARSRRLVHALIAVSAGFFLGVVFTHLLPEVSSHAVRAEPHPPSGHAGHHDHSSHGPWLWVLVGLLGLYTLEKLLLAGRSGSMEERHLGLSSGSVLGRGTHAVLAGLGLAAAGERPELFGSVFASVVSHESLEAFALASALLVADLSRRAILVVAGLFSLATPLGMILGTSLFDGAGEGGIAIAIALATGSFLFAAVCELLPEVFHHRRDTGLELLLLALGVLLGTWV